jgi:hypothetical protein
MKAFEITNTGPKPYQKYSKDAKLLITPNAILHNCPRSCSNPSNMFLVLLSTKSQRKYLSSRQPIKNNDNEKMQSNTVREKRIPRIPIR